MDISRLKKMFAGTAAVAMTLTQVGTAFAAYTDVPGGVWYEDAVQAFVDAGYLDSAQTRFRGGDNANRAEFVKLVVELNGGILSTAPSVPSFDDVKPGAWYYGYFEEAGKEGWVTGDNKCYGSHPCWARPSANINRAEAAAIIVRAFGLDWTGEAPKFVDNAAGQWYTDAIQTAADHCVLQGDDSTGRVRPSDNMNRAEMVVMLHRVDMNMSYSECAGGGEGPMEAALKAVITTAATKVEVEFNTAVDKDEALKASHYSVTGAAQLSVSSVKWIDDQTVELTLATAMTADASYTLSVQNMMTEDGETFSDTASFKGFSALPKGDGTLEVSVASSNPVGDTVPKGANGVVLMSLDLSASCDDSVSISNVTVLHEGFGAETDIDGIYATVDGARVSRKRTIDSQDQTSDLRFSSPLTIAACGTKTVDIVADFNSTAQVASEHNIAVELASDFNSNAKAVTGNFPMRGNTFKVAAVTSGKVTLTYRSVSPTKVEVGDTSKVLGKFEVSTDSVEDQTIYSMTVQNDGSAKSDALSNLKIRRTDGTVLTNTVASMEGDYATFVFDPPFTVLQGDKITMEIVADVDGGAGDTLQLDFEESSDIFAVGSLYGYGVNGQLYGSQVTISTSTTATVVTIDAGQFTVEIDGPVQQKYTRTTKDAVLANVILTTGGETIDLRKLFLAIQAQTATGAGFGAGINVKDVLEDVTLRNKTTGQSISAVRLTNQGTATTGDFFSNTSETWQIYRFDDFTVVGKNEWELRADFINNGTAARPTSGDKFRVHICGEPQKILDSTNALTTNTTGCDFGGLITSSTAYQMEVEGLSTGDEVGDIRPRGTITGNFHRIANPELTVAVQSIGNSDTAVKNSKNINLLRFQARAGEAEDVLLTKTVFAAASGSLLNAQNYTLWVDTDGDGVVDTILEEGVASQSSSVSFDDLAGGGYVIPAEETVIFEVHANIAASLQSGSPYIRLRFETGSTTSFVEAEQADDGSSLAGIKLNGSFLNSVTSADIIVTTTHSKLYNLVSQGDLFVTKSSTPVRSRQLLGGTVGDPILRLQFRAQNEDIDVTNLQLNSSGSNASSVDRLDLYKAGETTPFASATTGGCGSDDVLQTNSTATPATTVTFCASMQSRQLVVKKGQNLDVLVYPRMKTDEQGATSNQTIQLFITKQAVSNTTTGSGAVRARGSQSSNNLDANDATDAVAEGEIFIGSDTPTATNANIVGNVNSTVLSKYTQIVNANPDADNTNVPTGVSPFGQFKFTAATNSNTLNGLNKAVLSGVYFNVNATNVTMSPTAFYFYNKSDTSAKSRCIPFLTDGTTRIVGTASGSFLVKCGNLASTTSAPTGSGVNVKLDSGQNATFVLEGNITNAKVSSSANSTLQAALQDFTTYTASTFTGTTSHIIWADMDTSTTVFTWVEYPDTVVKSTSYKS
jgi:hypothetical protein